LQQKSYILFHTMQLYDHQGKRLYLTADERRSFIAAAAKAERPVRTFCTVLHDTGCQISEALALTPERIDLSGKAVARRPRRLAPSTQGGSDKTGYGKSRVAATLTATVVRAHLTVQILSHLRRACELVHRYGVSVV
jgi:integrase